MKRLVVYFLISALCFNVNVHAVEPRALLDVVDFSPPVMSPDGKKVAFRTERASVVRNTYDAFWYVADVDGASLPRRIADGGRVLRGIAGVSLPATPVWSPDGRWIFVKGNIAVWRAAVDGAGASAVTHDAADVGDFRLSNDGHTLRYRTGATRSEVRAAESAEYEKGIHIDPSVPLGQGLFRSGNVSGRAVTQRFTSGTLVRGPLLADEPGEWKEVNLTNGVHKGTTSVPAPTTTTSRAQPVESRDGTWKTTTSIDGWTAMLTRVGQQKDLLRKPDVVLSALAPQGGSQITCAASSCTGKQISGIQWRPGHREVVFTITDPAEGRGQSIYRWDVRRGTVRTIVHSRGLVNGGRARASHCAISTSTLVCVVATARQPPRLERIDIETGRRRVLFDPNAALAQAMRATTPVHLLRWKDKDGQVFTGQFYPARGVADTPAPLFVSYYQCEGFVRGGVGDEYPFASLAAHGIAALCINEAPYVRDPVARYDTGTAAVAGAVKFLSERGEVDCTKVGMGGLSFGSEVTLWTAMRTRLLTAAAASSPSLSSTYYLFNSFIGKKFTDVLRKNWGLGDLADTRSRWHLLAPQFNLDTISSPLLFQMSEQEYMFALDYAVPMIKQRMADLYVFPNEPHQKFQPRHKLAVYERNLDWFRFWLQGFSDKNPAKSTQYARWRKMRARVKAIDSVDPRYCDGGKL